MRRPVFRLEARCASAMKAEYMDLYALSLRGMLRWDEAKYRRMVMLGNMLNV